MEHLHLPRLRRKSQTSQPPQPPQPTQPTQPPQPPQPPPPPPPPQPPQLSQSPRPAPAALVTNVNQQPPNSRVPSAPASSAPAASAASASSGLSLITVPTNSTAVAQSTSSTSETPLLSSGASLKSRRQGLTKSTLRTLRLHSVKRARSPQIPQLLPPVAVVHHEPSVELEGGGVSLRSALSANRNSASETKPPSPRKRRVPVFLNQSIQDMMWKFADLQFLEATRSGAAERSQDPNHAWATYNIGRPRKPSMAFDRYFNIKPWNHNRVRLAVPASTIDYVNASVVTVPSTNPALEPHQYIAMQGPTPASVDHVWRMVAEQSQSSCSCPPSLAPSSPPPGPIVIVQLSKMVENGVSKCHAYFPSTAPFHDCEPFILNPHDRWGDGWRASLAFDGSETLEDGAIDKTRLLLRVDGEHHPRVVWHLLYQHWPDFGVPADSDLAAFFSLMRLSRELNTAGNSRIIHCSAGVGRTGTFIALEHLLRELEMGALENVDEATMATAMAMPAAQRDHTEISTHMAGCGVSLSPPSAPSPTGLGDIDDIDDIDPIFSTVNLLRSQRKQMVQAEAQFVFIYRVLRGLWLEKYWGRSTTQRGQRDGGEPARKRLGVEDPFLA